MDDIISLSLFIYFILIGYLYPIKTGWFALAVVTILGPTALTIAGSSFLPLTIYRIGFAISLGIAFKYFSRNLHSNIFGRSIFIKLLILFIIIISLLSFPDRAKNVIFNYIPIHFFAIIVPLMIVKDFSSLNRVLVIYTWISCVMGFSCILEYFTIYDLSIIIEKTIPGLELGDIGLRSKYSESPMERGGFYRPGGLWGNSVITGYAMAFLFPITLWYAISEKNILLRFVPIILSVIGIFLLQTRAVFFAVFISLLLIALLHMRFFKFKDIRLSWYKLIKIVTLISIAIIAIQPEILLYIKSYFQHIISSSMSNDPELSIIGKYNRIWIALSYFYESPLWGQLVSPKYVADILMDGADINSPVTYLISGGIMLLSLFMFVLLYMPFKTFKILKKCIKSSLLIKYKLILLYSTIAFSTGILVTFSNQIEGHFILMYILFLSIIKSCQLYRPPLFNPISK